MSLSQDEIDFLLKGGAGKDASETGAVDENTQVVLDSYGSIWIDSLGESIEGTSGKSLSASVENVGMVSSEEIRKLLTEETDLLIVGTEPPHSTPILFIVPHSVVAQVAALIQGAEVQDELTDEDKETVSVCWDQVAQSWQEKLSQRYQVNIGLEGTAVIPGSAASSAIGEILAGLPDSFGYFDCEIKSMGEQEGGSFKGIFGKDVIDALEPVGGQSEPAPQEKPQPKAGPKDEPQPEAQQEKKPRQPAKSDKIHHSGEEQSQTIQPVVFEPLQPENLPSEPSNLDLILDIKMEIRVELGRTHYRVKDILDLCPGYVVELNKLAGEPVDLLVNDKLFARGEVVVIDENFGVRITEILSLKERIESLR